MPKRQQITCEVFSSDGTAAIMLNGLDIAHIGHVECEGETFNEALYQELLKVIDNAVVNHEWESI